MQDTVLTALQQARLNGWLRMQELAGEMAHYWRTLEDEDEDEDEDKSTAATERLESLKQIACELLDELIPNCGWIRYAVYDPEKHNDGLVIVKICHNKAEFSRDKCTTVPIVCPSLEPSEPDPINLLQALGE